MKPTEVERVARNVPKQLQEIPRWVTWKSIQKAGGATKVPFQTNGKPASSTDAATWSTFEAVQTVVGKFAGPGFVFDGSGLVGIDLDACRDTMTLQLDPWARNIVLAVGSYAEVSPSGTGVKIFAQLVGDWTWNNKQAVDGPQRGGKHPGWEVYTTGRYFTVTGLRLSGMAQIASVDAKVLADLLGASKPLGGVLERQHWQSTPVTERAARYLQRMDPSIAGQKGHDKLFKAACILAKGFGLAAEECLGLLIAEFNPRCQPEWTERELRHKVKDAIGQPGPTGYLLEVQPINYGRVQTPTYKPALPQDPPAECQIITLEQAAYDYLEAVRTGTKKLIETGIPDLDYSIGGGISQGEVVIVAGRPNHGKSAIALQMLHTMTANGMPAVMISEEMTAEALGKRAIQFISGRPEDAWKYEAPALIGELSEHFSARAKAVIVASCGSVERACEEIERAVTEHGAQAAFVDYAQILSGGTRGKSLYENVTEVSKVIRRLTTRLNITTVLLAQLSRNVEGRDSFAPNMRDLKESGQLEQDADVIVFGVWPHRLDHTKPAKEYHFFIGKNRNRGIMQAAFQCEFLPSRQMMVSDKPSRTEWSWPDAEPSGVQTQFGEF